MMTFFIVLAAAAQAYLLGSVDTGILVSKYLYHDDVRNHGSGAAGMTNMLRTFGKKAAAMTATRACWWREVPSWRSSPSSCRC